MERSGKIITVLIVDQNDFDVKLIQGMLAKSTNTQFAPVHACSLAETIGHMDDHKFDVILVDLDLPDSEGLETIKKIRQKSLSVPLVVITGHTEESLGIEAVKIDAQDYLVKGEVNRGTLTRALLQAIERKKTEEIIRKYQENLEELVRVRTGVLELMNKQLSLEINERTAAEKKVRQELEKTKEAFDGIAGTITNMIEAREPYSAGHGRKTASLAAAIAREMELSDELVDMVRMAGMIHNIGTVAVPSKILNKPGKLTGKELSVMREHPARGFEMLKDITLLWALAEIVLQHHERIDGQGYPKGLKGEKIFLEARILAVADVVGAMVSHRSYRPAHGIDSALAEIESNKGKLYDKNVVEACLNLFRQKKFSFQ